VEVGKLSTGSLTRQTFRQLAKNIYYFFFNLKKQWKSMKDLLNKNRIIRTKIFNIL